MLADDGTSLCEVLVGVSGYVLLCQVFNDTVVMLGHK
jgi:hypothetical protein